MDELNWLNGNHLTSVQLGWPMDDDEWDDAVSRISAAFEAAIKEVEERDTQLRAAWNLLALMDPRLWRIPTAGSLSDEAIDHIAAMVAEPEPDAATPSASGVWVDPDWDGHHPLSILDRLAGLSALSIGDDPNHPGFVRVTGITRCGVRIMRRDRWVGDARRSVRSAARSVRRVNRQRRRVGLPSTTGEPW